MSYPRTPTTTTSAATTTPNATPNEHYDASPATPTVSATPSASTPSKPHRSPNAASLTAIFDADGSEGFLGAGYLDLGYAAAPEREEQQLAWTTGDHDGTEIGLGVDLAFAIRRGCQHDTHPGACELQPGDPGDDAPQRRLEIAGELAGAPVRSVAQHVLMMDEELGGVDGLVHPRQRSR